MPKNKKMIWEKQWGSVSSVAKLRQLPRNHPIVITMLFFSLLTFFPSHSQASIQPSESNTSRLVVHLLDYISQDYAEAVSKGKIINSFEFDEMMEFSENALKKSQSHPKLKNNAQVQTLLKELKSNISQKKSVTEVAQLASALKIKVVTLTGLQVAPSHWPDIKHGKKLYQKNCASCHGSSGEGNGLLSKQLDPKPTNFLDLEYMSEVAPFKAFNTITLGLQGTAMRSYRELSDKDIWDLAFYVISLRHQNKSTHHKTSVNISLSQAASLSDSKILATLSGSDIEKQNILSSLRLKENKSDSNYFIALAITNLDDALSLYKSGSFDLARNKALLAYLDGVEPVEPKLKANDAKFVGVLETHMGSVRAAIEAEKPFTQVEKNVLLAQGSLQKAQTLLQEKETSAFQTFLLTLGIILREALEAMLIIIALLAVIRSTGVKGVTKWVHGGWISAVLLGVVCWFFSGWLMKMSGAQREILEGAISLFAVAVLLYLGFWMHRQTHIAHWKKFIEEKVKVALRNKSLFGLFLISFIAVFREVFETVLFLRAIWLESAGMAKSAMLSGVLSSFVFVALLAWLLLRFSTRLPIQKLFALSTGVLIGLSIILTGKGFHALQESGMVSITSSPFNFRFDLIGLYPTMETVLPQVVLFVACLSYWVYDRKVHA